MTGKLVAYQLREGMRKQFLILSISILTFTLGAALILMRFTNLFITGSGNLLCVLSMIATAFIGFIFMIITDYQNFYGKRAYFVQSIPARTSALFSSRFLYYLITSLCLILIVVLEFIIFMKIQKIDFWGPMFGFYKNIFPVMLGLIFFSLICGILLMQTTVTLGSSPAFRKLGIGGPVVVYIILYVIYQVGTLLSMLFIPLGVELSIEPSGEVTSQILTQNMIAYYREDLFNSAAMDAKPYIGLGFLLFYLIISVVLLAITYREMKHRVSLT